MMDLVAALDRCPLIAILRGIAPEQADAVGDVLLGAGYAVIEVPLNSPQPLRSIERLARRFGDRALIGAGTVMAPADVTALATAGGRLVVMPHGDAAVIDAAKRHALACVPGVATPTEAFAALAHGADALKLFPAEALPPSVVRAWRAVLPRSVRLLPVGGIGAANMGAYLTAGANGFGIGSALYAPGKPLAALRTDAKALIEALARFREGAGGS